MTSPNAIYHIAVAVIVMLTTRARAAQHALHRDTVASQYRDSSSSSVTQPHYCVPAYIVNSLDGDIAALRLRAIRDADDRRQTPI